VCDEYKLKESIINQKEERFTLEGMVFNSYNTRNPQIQGNNDSDDDFND